MKNAEISMLIAQGRAYKSGSFLLRVLKNKENTYSKPGFVVSKKTFKNAVDRNKTRRRIKAALNKLLKPNHPLFFENKMVFMLSKEILSIDFADLVNEIKTIFEKGDIIKA